MNDDTHGLMATQRLVRAIRKVASAVARAEIANSKRLGTVTATSPLTVTLDGSTTAVSAFTLLSYTPAVNDRVVTETYGRQILVLGKFS